MVTVTFILDTGADTLANWLKATWRPEHAGRVNLQTLRDDHGRQGATRRLAADGVLTYEREGQAAAVAYGLETMVLFELLPLSAERLEVRAECRYHATLLPWFADLLAEMVKRWPVMRDTLDVTSNIVPDTETLQQALDSFAQRLQLMKTNQGKSAAPPPVPIDALKLSIMCQANTTARHLATALRNCGNRQSEWIAHDCKDWPPRECTHYILHRIDFQKPMDEDLTAVLSSILETKPKEGEPTRNTAIRFHLQEISSSPARVKLNILVCLVGSQALRELGNTLIRLFRDVPEAAQTTKFFPHFWPERELPEHLERSYNELTDWLKSKGGKEVDPFIEIWGYDSEVEALETQERRQAIHGEDGPAVNETPRDDGRAGIDGEETTADSGKTVRTHIAERREQVAKLKARGMTYIEIAEALSVSRETVQDDLQAMGLTRGSRKG